MSLQVQQTFIECKALWEEAKTDARFLTQILWGLLGHRQQVPITGSWDHLMPGDGQPGKPGHGTGQGSAAGTGLGWAVAGLRRAGGEGRVRRGRLLSGPGCRKRFFSIRLCNRKSLQSGCNRSRCPRSENTPAHPAFLGFSIMASR